MSPCCRRGAAVLASCLPALTAQQMVHRDGSLLAAAQALFDPARGRLVAGAQLGETWECDGSAWFRRPASHSVWLDSRWVWDGARAVVLATTSGLAAETWSYDGCTWQVHATAMQPPPRTDSMFAYDTVRGRAVLFGGTATTGPNYYLTDTWEYDGSAWTQQTPAVTPAWRRNGGLAFDPLRGVTVLFGGDSLTGFRQDTWEWDGAVWTQRGPTTQPSARMGAAMVWDALRSRIVLHGGLSANGQQNDVWTYDGTNWQPLTTTNPGPAHYLHSLHCDPANGELLAFGGYQPTLTRLDASSTWRPGPALPYLGGLGAGGIALEPTSGGVLRFGSLFDNATHVWNRSTWTSWQTPIAPARRMAGALWSDGQSAWLFGGTNTLVAFLFHDTWRFDGALWWPVASASAPSPRYSSAVAYDAVRGVAVLFGGYGIAPLDDTWTFDGVAWTQQSPAVRPAARHGHGLAFDPGRGRSVLFGGTSGTPSTARADTWEWNGAAWTQVAPVQSPPAVGMVALGFDARRQRILLSQAGTPTPGQLPPTLWTFDGVTWTPMSLPLDPGIQPANTILTLPGELDPLLIDSYTILQLTNQAATFETLGAGCGTPPLRLGARTLPRPAEAEFGFEIDRAPPGAPILLLLATGPGSLVVGGCTVGVAPNGLPLFLVADPRGAALLRLPLPASPALLGLQTFAQAFALAPGTASGFAASATLRVVVGD